MHEVSSNRFDNKRRRSERVLQSLSILIRGTDLLGQPFEERTSTSDFNLHGCRYSSKHHLSQNSWVIIEVQQNGEPRNIRARVAWSQRPQSVREFFQVAVELERPVNIWGLEYPPADWEFEIPLVPPAPERAQEQFSQTDAEDDFPAVIDNIEGNIEGNVTGNSNGTTFDSPLSHAFDSQHGFASADASFPSEQQPDSQDRNALPQSLTAELQRQGREAVEAAAERASEDIRRLVEETGHQQMVTAEEFFRKWKEEFERVQSGAREEFSGHLNAKQEDFLNSLQSKFEEGFGEARYLIEELDQKAQTIRAEAEAANQVVNRVAEARARMETVPLAPQPASVSSEATSPSGHWNELLNSELAVAQSQWSELLQSSLDKGIQRLAAQLSRHSNDVLRAAEQKLTERFAELRQPLAETAAEARETLHGIRSELEEEMVRARSSLADIERVAGRMREYSAQLESSSHDTLNELHGRLENMLDAQTEELNRRSEHLVHGFSQRLNPTIESLGHQLVERTIAEVESKLAPYLERVPDLIRELSTREIQAEEGLRLHRERLRQVAENNQRDVASQIAATLSAAHGDLESAKNEAFAKWNDELNASGVRAAQAASSDIGQVSEWFQQEARARLQVAVEQSLGTAANSFAEAASQSAAKLGEELERRSSQHLGEVERQVERVAHDVTGQIRTQLDEAAQSAAASFGEVLRGISGQEAQQFQQTAHNAFQERVLDLERSAQQVLGNLSVSAEASLHQLRTQMASQVESSIAEGRGALAAEFVSLRAEFAAERESLHQQWVQTLGQLSSDAAAKHQERLETASDSWMVSSVRRLNEHGQNTIESLMRLTDQSVRESCAKVFESFAEMMRNRTASANEIGVFVPLPGHDATQNSSAQ